MSKQRSGCRSCVLWPAACQPFLPVGDGSPETNQESTPFVAVLGGESPLKASDMDVSTPQGRQDHSLAVEPEILDLVAGEWHAGDTLFSNSSGVKREAPSILLHSSFLKTASQLRVERV